MDSCVKLRNIVNTGGLEEDRKEKRRTTHSKTKKQTHFETRNFPLIALENTHRCHYKLNWFFVNCPFICYYLYFCVVQNERKAAHSIISFHYIQITFNSIQPFAFYCHLSKPIQANVFNSAVRHLFLSFLTLSSCRFESPFRTWAEAARNIPPSPWHCTRWYLYERGEKRRKKQSSCCLVTSKYCGDP